MRISFSNIVSGPKFWNKVKYRIKDLYSDIRYEWLAFIPRLIGYLPVIWKDRDWDSAFALRLLQYKISRIRKYIALHKRHVNWAKDVKGMKEFEAILERIVEDDYCKKAYMKHFRIYPMRWDKRIPEKDDPKEIKAEPYTMRLRPGGKKERNEFKKISNLHIVSRKKDMDRMLEIMRKNIWQWWD